MISRAQFDKCFPACRFTDRDKYYMPIRALIEEFGLWPGNRLDFFLAQVSVESNQLRHVKENLNYSPEGIIATFNQKIQRFTKEQAKEYGRTALRPANQEMIASLAYADRYGNGDVESGDGWKYRGRGLMQVTFKDNYQACGKFLGLDLIGSPELLEEPKHSARAAGWYFAVHKDCRPACDAEDFKLCTKLVNGGLNGYKDRCEALDRIRKANAS